MKQHTQPCRDCPWRRNAVKGWLGSNTAQEWLSIAHSECVAECHTAKGGQQCAGMATYRANVAKFATPPMLRLKPDREKVFTSPMEFAAYHGLKKLAPILPIGLIRPDLARAH